MKNKFFNCKYILAHKASNYPFFYSAISRILTQKKDWFTNKHTDIVIDGFPRCANTYATYAFKIVQPQKISIAHHIHKKSQFLTAARYNIPAILLIRKPLECISSLLVRQPRYDASTLFHGYYYLYSSLKDLNTYVVGDFETVLNNYEAIIKSVNDKFGRNFTPYIKSKENEQRLKIIIHSQDELINSEDAGQKIAYPNAEKQHSIGEARVFLMGKEFERSRKKCDEIYEEILQKKLGMNFKENKMYYTS